MQTVTLEGAIRRSVAHYRVADYALKVWLEPKAFMECGRASIGTITFALDRATKEFESLDAYTNRSTWAVDPHLLPPAAEQEMRLAIAVELDQHGIGRVDELGLDISWTTDIHYRILRIRVCDSPAAQYIRFAEGLEAGITSQNTLSELWITNLRMT